MGQIKGYEYKKYEFVDKPNTSKVYDMFKVIKIDEINFGAERELINKFDMENAYNGRGGRGLTWGNNGLNRFPCKPFKRFYPHANFFAQNF